MAVCFITQLDAVASSESLRVFGGVSGDFEGQLSLGQNYFVVWTDSSKTKYRIKDGYLRNSNGIDIEGVSDDTTITKAIAKSGKIARLTLLNKEDLKSIAIAPMWHLGDFKGCVNLTTLPVGNAKGDIGGLSDTKLASIGFTENADVYGELAEVPSTMHTINGLENSAKNRITYKDADARAESNSLAIYIPYPTVKTFASKQDLENYLIASAKCAYGRSGNPKIEGLQNVSLSQKAKEAVWLLKNKMYANVGDTQRTSGSYFTIEGVDLTGVSEPNW